jgi:8-oxo-dGTP pyrophosphatase MutT (NUDIX family)
VTGPSAYRFCPCCGALLDCRILKAGEPPRLVCRSCAFVFFLDPKVATGVVFPYGNGILLVQRAIEPSYGKWVFPGGYVDRGETLEAAALREVREESGLCVRLTRLLGAYSQPDTRGHQGLPERRPTPIPGMGTRRPRPRHGGPLPERTDPG